MSAQLKRNKNKHTPARRARTARSRVPHRSEVLPPLDGPDPAQVETYERVVSAFLKKEARKHGEPVDGFETMHLFSRAARATFEDSGLPPEYAEAARLRALDGTGWPRPRGAGSIDQEAREKRDLLDVPRPRAIQGEHPRRSGKR